MARGNMFLGQARGRVGSVVFSRRQGKQITRTYNPEPSNPKTDAQALQRAQFATVIAASVGLKEVINNSFDGVKNGQPSVNEFVSRNLSDIKTRGNEGNYVANEWLVPKGQSFIQPQPWIISRGNIGTLKVYAPNLNVQFLGVGEDSDPDYYIANASELERQWFYKPGCQLTFVALVYIVDPITNESRIEPQISRLVFNNLAPTGESMIFKAWSYGDTPFIPAEYLDLTKTDLPLVVDENVGNYVNLPKYFSVNNVGGLVANGQLNEGTVVGFGIITTYLENGTYRHTTSVMDYDTDAYDYTFDAVSTYKAQEARRVVSSDYYTEQPATDQDYNEVPTLNEVVSAQISALGMNGKGVFIGQSNSYGPVAEGNTVILSVNVPARFQITSGSVKAYNGETPLGNDWTIHRMSANYIIIDGPMPTTTSFPFNVSFHVYDTVNNADVGTAALRINVSKANA